MNELHIGDFYKDVAGILAALYKRFPTKSALYIEDVCGPDEPDEFGLHSPRYTACFSAALWLAEEGYLRFSDTIQQEAFDECVLTQKAFLTLSAIDISPGQSRAAHIIALLKEGNSEKLNGYVSSLMKNHHE